jgi:putative secretion ATPase (PEP-CTERM system associated)
MYLEYYNFKEFPFQMTPDHRFFFESATHRKAMANLVFGLEQSEGFIVISGEVGSGKTTLLDHMLDQLDPTTFLTGRIVSTHLQADDMLRAVAAAFQLPFAQLDKASLLDRIHNFLLECHAANKRVLLLVDEAQNIPPAALEELRMLSNFQVQNRVPLQSVMLAQPQFRHILSSPDLDQFRQRIIASYHLSAMSAKETGDYIRHRMTIAGWAGDPAISDGVMDEIFRITGGIPRKINWFCSRVLLHAYLDELHVIDVDMITNVEAEVNEQSQMLEAVAPESGGVMQPNLNSPPTQHLDGIERRLVRLERVVQRQAKTLRFLTSQANSDLDLEGPE